MTTRSDADGEWEKGWSAHEKAQLVRLARLPLAEKLRWLEEAARVVEHLSVSGRQKRSALQRPDEKVEEPV